MRADSNRSSTASWKSGPSGGGNSLDSSVGTLSSCGTLFSDSGNSQDRNWKNGRVWTSLSVGSDNDYQRKQERLVYLQLGLQLHLQGKQWRLGQPLSEHRGQLRGRRRQRLQGPSWSWRTVTSHSAIPPDCARSCKLRVISGLGEQTFTTASKLRNPIDLNLENWID